MKHVVLFSGGLSSAYVAYLVLQEQKKEDVVLLHTPTYSENHDADTFRHEVARYLGVPITEWGLGLDIWELIEKNNCIPGQFIPFCTQQLKQKMKELGYELHARMIWDKENGIAPAFTVRYSHEYLLWFYKKGSILMPCKEMRGKYTTVLRESATKHSKKPTCAYEMIENMFPEATKLEMFARNIRNGWDCWGNEV